jgi:hypothetical protein
MLLKLIMLYKFLYSNTRRLDKPCQYIKLLQSYSQILEHDDHILNTIKKYNNKVLTPKQQKALRITASIITVQVVNKIKGKKASFNPYKIESQPNAPVKTKAAQETSKPLQELPEFIIYEEGKTKLKILKSNLEYFINQAKRNKLTHLYNYLCAQLVV